MSGFQFVFQTSCWIFQLRRRRNKSPRACILLLTIGFFATLLSHQPAWGQTLYQIDDGVSENSLGNSATGDYFWGNYFEITSTGPNVNGLSIAFGDAGVPTSTPFQVALYSDVDCDFNPTTGLELLVSVLGTVESTGPVGTDAFQQIDIPVTEIDGCFFVAVLMGSAGESKPAKIDQTFGISRSWFAEHNVVGGLDITDPFGSSTVSGLIDDFDGPGNFLVRATAQDCLRGDVNRDQEINLLDIPPFIDLVLTGTYQCEGDMNL